MIIVLAQSVNRPPPHQLAVVSILNCLRVPETIITHWIHLVPSVVLGQEVNRHDMATHRGHLECCWLTLSREHSLEFIHIACTARGFPSPTLLTRKNLRQRTCQGWLFCNHQNFGHAVGTSVGAHLLATFDLFAPYIYAHAQ